MQAARTRAQERKSHVPQATGAAYNPATGLVCIRLSNGVVIGLPAAQTQGLETADSKSLSKICISPSGYGIHFPKLAQFARRGVEQVKQYSQVRR